MTSDEINSHSCRSAPIEASIFLHKSGFDTLRTTGSTLFDLVAWKDGRVVFLTVKRSRNSGISKWSDLVFRLVDLVKAGTIPGEVQFWLCRSHVWHRYQILPGGAAPVEWSA